MKRRTLFLRLSSLLLPLFALTGCGGTAPSPYRVASLNAPFTLRVGETVRLADDERTEVSVTVVEDTRCPLCARPTEGVARVQIELQDAPVRFPTTTDVRMKQGVVLALGMAIETTPASGRPAYWIKPESLTPVDKPTNSADYVVTLQLRRKVIE
jgi:hypothetical protein